MSTKKSSAEVCYTEEERKPIEQLFVRYQKSFQTLTEDKAEVAFMERVEKLTARLPTAEKILIEERYLHPDSRYRTDKYVCEIIFDPAKGGEVVARPVKQGLDYFPLDIKLDDEAEIIEATHGLEGFGVMIKLFMKIYGSGYYIDWDFKQKVIFAKRIGLDPDNLQAIIDDCITWNIFDEDKYKSFNILTSKQIQERYTAAVYKRTNVIMKADYLLIDVNDKKYITVNDDGNKVNDDGNPSGTVVNDDRSTQSKGKESKRKNNTAQNSSETTRLFETFWDAYGKKTDRKAAEKKFNAILNSKDPDRRATAEEMITGAKNYKAHMDREQTEMKFRKNATTFLNQESFRDYQQNNGPDGISNAPAVMSNEEIEELYMRDG